MLTPQETDQLFEAIRRLRDDGLAVVFISHKLNEVQRICDDLTILRQGVRVHEGPAAGLSAGAIAEWMVGRQVAPLPPRNPPDPNAPLVLRLEGVAAAEPRSGRRIENVNLSVRSGEIVGVAGVEGNGQDVLAGAVVGVHPVSAGRVVLDGTDLAGTSVRGRTRAGIAHVPDDRQRQGLVPAMTLRENLILKRFREPPFARRGILRPAAAAAHATERLLRFDVRARSPEDEAASLSGGNQQKLILARELHGEPRVVVAHNPVRGLDVAATQFVFAQLIEQRRRGAAVLLIHSDLDELLTVSDRVAVMYAGRCIETDWPAGGRAAVGRLMLGGRA